MMNEKFGKQFGFNPTNDQNADDDGQFMSIENFKKQFDLMQNHI
jgi:hypothetical protein